MEIYVPAVCQFLSQLSKQFEKSKKNGSMFITFKRYAPEKGSKKKDDEQKLSEETVDEPDKEYPCLVRSVMGKSKISTLVQPNDTDRFHEAYTNIIKMHMDALKKKERPKKAKKAKKIAA